MLYERDDIVNCHTEYFLNFKFNWVKFLHTYRNIAVADPGFPVGGGGGGGRRPPTHTMDPVGGGGGVRRRCPLDPRMYWVFHTKMCTLGIFMYIFGGVLTDPKLKINKSCRNINLGALTIFS